MATVWLAASFVCSCGGSSNSPTPVTQPPSPGPPSSGPSVNLAPVVESISASSDRVEVDNEITLTATVKDQETPVDQLKCEWKAPAGSFSGEGVSVKWRAPKDVKTPADYEITLVVTESCGVPTAQGATAERDDRIGSAVRVHNSRRNSAISRCSSCLTLPTRPFRRARASAISVTRAVENKTSGGDIEANRVHFEILSSSLSLRSVTVASSGLSANMTVACSFTSRIKACDAGDKACVVGDVGTAKGDCILTGKYENRRWWLCDSHFAGKLLGSLRSFFGLP